MVPGLVPQGQPPSTTVAAEGARDRRARHLRRFLDGGARGLGLRSAPVQRNPGAGPDEALPGTTAAARPRRAGERRRALERQPRRASGRNLVHGHRTTDRPRFLLTRPRATIVVTGSELVRGERQDRNGPFLAAEALRLGSGAGAHHDRRGPTRRTSSAHSPTASTPISASSPGGSARRTTIERSSWSHGSPAGELVVDHGLEREIEAGLADDRGAHGAAVHGVRHRRAPSRRRFRPARCRSGSPARRQDSCSRPTVAVVVVLPGPPRELRRLWPRALETEPVQRVLERAPDRGRGRLRFFGTPESAVARALADAGGDGDGVEATICAREFEIHVDLVVDAGRGGACGGAGGKRSGRARALSVQRGRALGRGDRPRPLPRARSDARGRGVVHRWARRCAPDGRSGVERRLPRERRRVRERGQGGGARRVPPSFSRSTERSPPRRRRRWRGCAGATRRGRRRRGHGGRRPGGGTEEKPVGLVLIHAVGPDGEKARRIDLPGDRETVRGRATAAALHLVRQVVGRIVTEGVSELGRYRREADGCATPPLPRTPAARRGRCPARRLGRRATSCARGRSRASTSPSRFSAHDLDRARRDPRRLARAQPRRRRSSSSRCATARRVRSGCSFSAIQR